MEISEGQVIYEQTADPNVVKRYWLQTDEIHIDKLQAKIADLTNRIAEIPEDVTSTDDDPLVLKAVEDQNVLFAKTREVLTDEKTELDAIQVEIDKLR